MRGYLGLTEYTPDDALAIESKSIEVEDTELIEKLTRLRKTFDGTYRGEESS